MASEEIMHQSDYVEQTAYERWMASEGIPIVEGYYVEDLNTVPLEPWPRKGGSGAFLELVGSEEASGAHICEIPPGSSLKPEKYLYEEMIYILSGRGATTIWNEGGIKQTFEWQEGSLFAPPLNVWREHFNSQGDRPARYLSVNSAPLVMNLFHNLDFIFNNDFIFKDRYSAAEDYFSSGRLLAHKNLKIWESNFIPDTRSIKLHEAKQRGAGGTNIQFELSDNTMAAHISEFPVGTYKKAHRHGPAANVILLDGEGYSLMWPEGQPWMKIDWHRGSLFVPPDRWFHQHFNTGRAPARYLALRWMSNKHRMGKDYGKIDESFKEGGNQIEYEDESPEVRRLFEEELAKQGVEIRMPPVARG